MPVTIYLLLPLVFLCGNSLGQNNGAPISPCPNIFQYVQDQNGGWQGRVTIIPPIQFSEAKLQLKLTVNYFPLSAGVGGITFNGGKQEIQAISDTASRNERQQINYVINFPPGKPLPRVAQVVINGKEFCPNVPTYPDTRGEINLSYNLNTGLRLAAVGGNQFIAPGNGISAESARPGAAPYIPKPIATEYPPDYYQPAQYRPTTPAYRPVQKPVQTQRPYYEQPTTRRPQQSRPEQSSMTSPDQHQHHRNAFTPEVNDCLKHCEQREEVPNSKFQRKDSIKCIFDPKRELPDEFFIHKWINETLRIPGDQVEVIQPHKERRLVYIKMKQQMDYNFVNKFNGKVKYTQPDGRYNYEVTLTFAGIGEREIRVLNLPPEVPEEVIKLELENFGHVYEIINEVWSDCYYYRVNNGVKSVRMYLDKHIPYESVLFEQHRGLIIYEGQPIPCKCYEKEKISKGCQHITGGGRKIANTPSV